MLSNVEHRVAAESEIVLLVWRITEVLVVRDSLEWQRGFKDEIDVPDKLLEMGMGWLSEITVEIKL